MLNRTYGVHCLISYIHDIGTQKYLLHSTLVIICVNVNCYERSSYMRRHFLTLGDKILVEINKRKIINILHTCDIAI